MNESALFHAALKLPPDQRTAFLDAACADNPRLRADVDALLREHASASGLLGEDPVNPPKITTPGTDGTEHFAASKTGPGTVIGPYKLLQQIGEGGMGVVYTAEQTQPIRRRVALKIIKPGMDSREVIARFESERQALALMDHPNIARVLDAGATTSGRPFFVMELVKGVPITEFCDAHSLPMAKRLVLFISVCQAVQHAHQKGIIHRDIKPSNVLVELHDETPVVKVIDFGVAKAIGQPLTEKTLYTGFGSLIGTPTYMAPEQATFNALDVDTRADVYALGILLYELLVGTPPVEPERLKKAAIEEVLRIVREEEPPAPSQRLSSSEMKATIAAVRQSQPLALVRLVRGELDWIVMKALEKERTRRYDSAGSLAKDVERYLQDEPVEARPTSAWYRFQKLARRHRGALLTSAVVATALIVGLVVSVWQAVRATKAEQTASLDRDAAVTARGIADRKTNEANAALSALQAAQEQRLDDQYVWDMQILPLAYEAGDVTQVNRILDRQIPTKAARDRRAYEWHYWQRQINSSLEAATLPVPEKGTQKWAFSPDGSRLARLDATLGPQKDASNVNVPGTYQLHVWDTVTREELLAQQYQAIASAYRNNWNVPLFSRDNQLVAFETPSASWRTTTRVEIQQIPSGKILLRFNDKHHPSLLSGAKAVDAFSADGKLFASFDHRIGRPGQVNRSFRVWEMEGIQRCQVFPPGVRELIPAPFTPDGTRIVTFSKETDKSRVVFWEVATGKEALAWEIPGGQTFIFALSPDGKQVAGANDKGVRVWSADAGQQLFDIPYETPWRPYDRLSQITYSPDGTRLAVLRNLTAPEFFTAQPAHVTLVDPQQGKPIAAWEASSDPIRAQIQQWPLFSPDGQLLVVPADHELRIWSANNGALVRTIREFVKPVAACAFSADSKHLWAVDEGGNLKRWSAAPPAPARMPWFRDFSMKAFSHLAWFAVSGDGSRVAYIMDDDHEQRTPRYVQVVTPTGEQVQRFELPPLELPKVELEGKAPVNPAHCFGCLSLSNDGRRVALLRGHWYMIYEADGRKFAGRVNVWREILVYDVATGALLMQRDVTGALRDSLTISPDGCSVIYAIQKKEDEPTVIMAVDVDTKKEQQVFELTPGGTFIQEMHFSPNGRRLAVFFGGAIPGITDVDAALAVIDLSERRFVWQSPWEKQSRNWTLTQCNHFAWSPDGKQIASTRLSPRVSLLDAATGLVVKEMDIPESIHRSEGGYAAPVFSPDGKRLAALLEPMGTSQIKLWDIASGKELLSVQNAINRTRSNGPALDGLRHLFFSDNGRRLGFAENVVTGNGTPPTRDATLTITMH